MSVQWWVSSAKAAEYGCTHKAWFMGLVPGFFNPDTNLWVSRSDFLNPIEDALCWLWASMRRMRGEDEDFMFYVTGELAQ